MFFWLIIIILRQKVSRLKRRGKMEMETQWLIRRLSEWVRAEAGNETGIGIEMEKKMKTNNGSSVAAPTGCYKCGRSGHWSQNCTFAPTTSKPPNFPPSSSSAVGGKQQQQETPSAEAPKVKKPPRTHPKLTADILLSNDGLGYVLEHIPHMLHLKGPSHEVHSPPFFLIGLGIHFWSQQIWSLKIGYLQQWLILLHGMSYLVVMSSAFK